MKQLLSLSLFLFLLPCLAWAQYPSNGNQKITLGEQTTADGLIWRGVSSDTTLTTKSDTAAYFVLDTVNKKLYFYKVSAIPKWNEISGSGGSTLDTATMLLPYYRSGRTGIIQALDVPTLNQNTTGSAATLTTSRTFQTNLASTSTASFNGSANVTPGVTGTLPVANGGTGATTPTAALNALLPTQSQSTTIGATLKSNGTNTYWDNFSAAGTVQDISGNFYNTVAIGTQVWFKENLRTKKYRSGALIPVVTNTDSSTLVGQMYYYVNDSLTNYSIYGALYNWKATQSSDSLCPVGWHVPTDTEFTTLTTFLGGVSVAGGKMKSVGTSYWNSPNTGATNESSLSILPGGNRNVSGGSFSNIKFNAVFWTSTSFDSANAYIRFLNYDGTTVDRYDSLNKALGTSIRCIKN
jgi:uncharacterized protein (TIGR02145 family)